MSKIETTGRDDLWEWFGLSYSAFAVLPRVMMQEMPDRWQKEMAKLLDEADNAFFTRRFMDEMPGGYTVRITDGNGKLSPTPEWMKNYRRPDSAFIKSLMRTEVDDNDN